MRFKICGLGKLLVASVKRTDVRPIPRMDPDVCSEVEIKREAFPASLESALKWFLSRVDQLMPLQFRALNKGFSALGAHVDPGTMRMEMFSHC